MKNDVNQNEYLPAGKIVSTHGIRGELRLLPCCDGPELICSLKTLYIDNNAVTPLKMRSHKSLVLLTLPGVDDVDKALRYIGKEIYFKKSDVSLPGGVYFIADLIGLEVYDLRTKRVIGRVADVLKKPANNVYVVSDGENEYLIPEAGNFIDCVDLENGVMRINSIEGMV